MDKRTLVKTLRTKRAEWESLLAQVDEARMVEPGAAGHWSVKDIIAHITQYESWMLANLQALRQGERLPLFNPWDMLELDERNARIYDLHRDKSLAQVQAEARDTFDYIITAVKTLSQTELNHPFDSERSVGETVCYDTYEHYAQHVGDLENWIASTRGT
ncbi:MAG: DinB family protein [Anaerolineae bacterium]